VKAWARDNREFLRKFEPHDHKKNYLRVISRVYLTGRLNISLQSSRSVAATAAAGAPKPVDLVVPRPGTDPQKVTLDSYKENIKALNDMLEEALKKIKVNGVDRFLPGGTVKVVSASANSISLSETFNRPVVIGYLGFDMEIGLDGDLGPPIPTHAVLEKKIFLLTEVRTAEYVKKERQERVRKILDLIDTLSPVKAFELNEHLPVKNEEIEKIVDSRDPGGKRRSDEKVAKEMLKMRVGLGGRSDAALDAWEAAVRAAQ
jgi:hypothetical protein